MRDFSLSAKKSIKSTIGRMTLHSYFFFGRIKKDLIPYSSSSSNNKNNKQVNAMLVVYMIRSNSARVMEQF